MKKLTISFSLMAFLAFAVGCGNSQNSDMKTTDSSSTMSTQSTDTTAMATAPSATKDTSMADDRKFLMEAASGGLMEVELGKIAEAHAASAQVKEYGKMMVTDHSKANAELKTIAASKNVAIPTAPAEKEQKHIDELKSKKGTDFDKAYVDMMVDDHKEDISKFQDEANKGNDADVKAFASKTLPVLNKHLEHITTIQNSMKK